MLSSTPPKVRCRQIQDQDLEAIIDLLTEGFPDRPRNYWTSGFARLATRDIPESYPRFGYMLDEAGAPVGVLLLIYTGADLGADQAPRFNVSSWYVRPAYRGYASLMAHMALKRRAAVYLNTSPMPHTLPMLSAMGFAPLSRGQVVAAPGLSKALPGAKVIEIGPYSRLSDYPDQAEFALLRAHAAQGCVSLVVREADRWTPLVFLHRHIRYAPTRTLQLAYCHDTADFVRVAGAVGRFLARSGHHLVICDANGPIKGLAGVYVKGKSPKYFRGPAKPRLNDLAFTEATVFGA